jgi:hypothetical protein
MVSEAVVAVVAFLSGPLSLWKRGFFDEFSADTASPSDGAPRNRLPPGQRGMAHGVRDRSPIVRTFSVTLRPRTCAKSGDRGAQLFRKARAERPRRGPRAGRHGSSHDALDARHRGLGSEPVPLDSAHRHADRLRAGLRDLTPQVNACALPFLRVGPLLPAGDRLNEAAKWREGEDREQWPHAAHPRNRKIVSSGRMRRIRATDPGEVPM